MFSNMISDFNKACLTATFNERTLVKFCVCVTLRLHDWCMNLKSKAEHNLKLVRIPFYYDVLGTSSAAIFLSNDHSLYAPIYLTWTSCLISFV